MKKYIVGGFCRDKLLGLTPKDKDYVLVNAKPKDIEYLKSIGFEQVGVDFPVFRSPDGHEHAVARTERKNGTGYAGFDVETEGVTLEEDLYRRDLTINAIAYDPVLKVHIDPYNGKKDLSDKVLRHVSPHFSEDPLRVLRLARFGARYSNFTVHDSTTEMVIEMVKNGEIDHLTKERVYVEFEKAFSEDAPSVFLMYLKEWGALKTLLPGLEKLSKKNAELIDKFKDEGNPSYSDEFIWMQLLSMSTATISKDYVVGSIKLPARFVKFYEFISTYESDIKTFRKKSPEELAQLFFKMNIHNKGGEEFLYKVLEFFNIRREVDSELETLILKVYDQYEDTDIGDIQQMLKDGDITANEIKDYILTKKTDAIKKMFS